MGIVTQPETVLGLRVDVRHGQKLTIAQADEIRDAIAGGEAADSVAARFGISRSHALDLSSGRRQRLPGFWDRFWARVDRGGPVVEYVGTPCWVWTGAIHHGGYGVVSVLRRSLGVHRVSWERHHGQIPDGLVVCHRCDVRTCVRPDHLFLGTIRENALDSVAKGRAALGPRNHNAKLDAVAVLEIRARRAAGESLGSIGAAFGVSDQSVRSITTRKTWKHVEDQ